MTSILTYRCPLLLILSLCLIPYIGYSQTTPWVAPDSANSLKNPHPVNQELLDLGKKSYDMICWTCHGKTGAGDGPAGMALSPTPGDFTDPELQKQSDGALFWKLTKGRPPMIAFEHALGEKERWALVAYIRQLAKEKKEN